MINAESWIRVGRWFNLFVRVFPFLFAVLFGWWVWQAVGWNPEDWWNPFKATSPGTMVFQWAILLGLVLLANRWLAGKIKAPDSRALAEDRKRAPFEKDGRPEVTP
jgi:NSS family neurotransmitter:Na+ symporter